MSLFLPDGTEYTGRQETAGVLPDGEQQGMVVNETDLPDEAVMGAVETYFEEHASVLGANSSNSFQRYAGGDGSLFARSKFRMPSNTWDEIQLARELAERDDDVAATMGAMIALAFGEGMEHTHQDEITLSIFDEIAGNANLDAVLKEMYREWLIAAQCTTISWFSREAMSFTPPSEDRQRQRGIVSPTVGVMPAEQVRVVGNDMFGTAQLAYRPLSARQEQWLEEFFAPSTTAGRKREMRQQDPVLTTLLTGQIRNDTMDQSLFMPEVYDPAGGQFLYTMNPRMAHRATMPKGAWGYPRPLMTRNFGLVEAKRLLNLLDYALLQGGSNYVIVAKKGTDKLPARQGEVDNLRDVVRRASRTGVVIGDHRLAIEIITPNLGELLSEPKRRLVGRKIASGLLRTPEGEENAAGEGVKFRSELIPRVIESDRRDLRRLIERGAYTETVRRNPGQFPRGNAKLWFPKIILAGTQYFTDYIVKLRDRGDISRRTAVAAAGFDYDAEVQQRKREKPDDRVMVPASVPFNSPNNQNGAQPGQGQGQPRPTAPVDNHGGRPRGVSSNNGRGRPRGEPVRAMYEEETGHFRCGELTYRVLEQFPERTVGRLTGPEQRYLRFVEAGEWPGDMQDGPLTIVGVNEEYALRDYRALRLAEGLSMIVGYRDEDEALCARAFCFREPQYRPLDAEERALRWGFITPELEPPLDAE